MLATAGGQPFRCVSPAHFVQAVWYQKLTTLTASSSWKKVARGDVMSVYVPKATGVFLFKRLRATAGQGPMLR